MSELPLEDKYFLIPTKELVKLAESRGFNFGWGNPNNRLRYYTKTGLIPHAVRKQVGKNSSTEGHYPLYAVDLLLKIQELKNKGVPFNELKLLMLEEKLKYEVATASIALGQELSLGTDDIKVDYSKNFIYITIISFLVLLSLAGLFLVSRSKPISAPPSVPSSTQEVKGAEATERDFEEFFETSGNLSFLAPNSENLLINSSFERGESSITSDVFGTSRFGQAYRWGYLDQAHQGNIFVANESIRSGTLAYEIYDETIDKGFCTSCYLNLGISQKETQTINDRAYILSIYVRTRGLIGEPIFRLGFRDKTSVLFYQDFNLVPVADQYADWQLYTLTYEKAKLGTYPFFEIIGYSGGKIYFDDASLYEATINLAGEDGIQTNLNDRQIGTLNLLPANTSIGAGSITVDAFGNIYPITGGTGSVGTVDNTFGAGYFGQLATDNNLTVGNDLIVNGAITAGGNLTFTGDTITISNKFKSSLIPNTDATYDIGSSDYRWRNLYISGTTSINGVTYTWPGADGGAGQLLSTNGSGTLSWIPSAGVGLWTDAGTYIYANNATNVVVTDTSRIGIGISIPLYALDVNGDARIQSLGAGATNTVITHNLGVLEARTIDSRVWGSALIDAGGVPVAGQVGYFTDSNTLAGSNNFFWDAGTSRLGLGTTAPTTTLDVRGNATVSGTLAFGPNVQGGVGICDESTAGIMYYNGPANAYYYCNGTTWTQIGTGAGGTNYWQRVTGALIPQIVADDLMIGGDATASALFHVYGSGATAGWATMSGTLTIGQGQALRSAYGPLNLAYKSDPNTWTTGLTLQDTNGYVGIGTTAPGDKLDVIGEIDTSTYYKLGNQKILDVENTDSLLIGHGAGNSIPAGANENTLIGYNAGYSMNNSAAEYNTAIGSQALYSNIVGFENVAIGQKALFNTTSSNNVGVGAWALQALQSGAGNTALGDYAGDANIYGSSNLFLGLDADASTDSINASIAIGRSATTTASNQLVIGGNGVGINDAYFGEGVTNATPLDITFNSTGGSGDNIAGANFIFAGGKGTGTGDGGDLIFKTSDVLGTGSTLQSLTEKMRLTDEGNLGIGTTAPISKLHLSGAVVGKALAIFDELGDQNVFTASASGVTVANLTRTGDLELKSQGDLRLYDSDNSNYTGFQAPALSANILYTLPTADGTANQVLATNASGTLSWIDSTAVSGTLWQRNSGALSPANITDDLLIGGIATSSAVFQVYGSGTNAGAAVLKADTLTTGTAFNMSFDTLTTGKGLYLETTSANLSTGNLVDLYWGPNSFATASGDLFRINIGANADLTGNLLALYDNSSDIFKVSTVQITSAVPHQFTASGDISLAYDMVLTNQTASNIKSYGPFTIEAGESYESNNLTLKTYNAGQVVIDSQLNVLGYATVSASLAVGFSAAPAGLGNAAFSGNVGIGNTAPSVPLDVTGNASVSGTLTIGQGQTLRSQYGPLSLAYKSALNAWTTGITLQDTTGNVGIGTTGPGNKLHIYGTTADETLLNIQSTQNIAEAIQIRGLNQSGIGFYATQAGTDDYFIYNNYGDFMITNGTDSRTILDAYATGDLIILPAAGSGNVGIGNTAPSVPLDVTGSASVSGTLTIGQGQTLRSQYGPLSLAYKSALNAWTTGFILQDTTGYVGIGTTAPTATLSVGGASSVISNATGNLTITPASNLIISSGNLGIGTTTPLWKLHVSDSQAATASAMIENIATNQTAGHTGLIIKMGTQATATNANDRFISFMSGENMVGKIQGTATAGIINYATSGVDFGEYFVKGESSSYEEGDVVSLGTDEKSVVKSTSPYDGKIVGVVSNRSGFTGGEEGPNKVQVGLVGQIPVKIAPNSQSIIVGDILTSSDTPGKAQKAVKAGTILGKAMESWSSNSGKDKIWVYINVSWYDPSAYITADGSLESGNLPTNDVVVPPAPVNVELEARILGLEDKYASLSSQIADHTDRIAQLESYVSAFASGSGYIQQPQILGLTSEGDATVSGNLMVLGKSNLSDVAITGKLSSGLLVVDGLDLDASGSATINTLAGPLKLQSMALGGVDILNGKVTIDTKGNLKAVEVTAEKYNVDDSDITKASVGSITLPSGETSVTVHTKALTDKSLIFVSPERGTPVGARKTGIDTFVISLTIPDEFDLKVNWWVIN